MNSVETTLGGKPVKIETGKVAKQSNGSVWVTYGDTVVLVTVCATPENMKNADFFPLTCIYQMKYYSQGRIPGGFIKRESKPSDNDVLTSRMIDRPIRPLFPKNYMAETQIIATVHSYDEECSPQSAALLGASAALAISDLPFEKPIAGVSVGLIDGEIVINPTVEQQKTSDLDMFMAASKDAITMVECGANEVSEEMMLEVLQEGHDAIKTLIEIQEKLVKECGKPKRELEEPDTVDSKLAEKIKKFAKPLLEEAYSITTKMERYDALRVAKKATEAKFIADEDEPQVTKAQLGELISEWKRDILRSKVLDDGKRVDDRGPKDIRRIDCEVGVLPRAHGSALFTRGETQALVTTTLGTKDDEQMVDDATGLFFKRFYLHYSFPPYSVGEVKRIGPPGRREVGHGYLAERGLTPVLPANTKFPYTLRVASEITESNGSSSMATVCGGTLALMDAGVPLTKPVAGIAMGLISEGKKSVVLSDILGDEDHIGDMDFKVVGTNDGITALQMDIKIDGLKWDTVKTALAQAKDGRLHILKNMDKTLKEGRDEVSRFAPRFIQHKISINKIRDIIGPGGQVIKNITAVSGAKIEVNDTGMINISSKNKSEAETALNMIQEITKDIDVGGIYNGTIKKVMNFGVFVECFPGTEGLVHVSELGVAKDENIEDSYSEGQKLKVRAVGYDQRGKLKLSVKDL